MTTKKKPGDLTGILAQKGEATSSTSYPGDDEPPAAKPTRTRRKSSTGSKKGAPDRYQYQPRPRRSDSLTIRLSPEERELLESLAERTGAPLTQVVIWGLEALRENMDDG